MAFKLNATAYKQELHKSDPTSIDQVVAAMQKVSPEAKATVYGKLGVKYPQVPQAVATLFTAYPNGVSLPVVRVVPMDIFANYADNGFAPVMDMGEDAFVVMDVNTGLLHQFNRKANTVCEGNGADFNGIVKDIRAEENWRDSVKNLKATFSGLKEATESFKFSNANLTAAYTAKAKIQNALDVVAKEGWDENKPYTLGLGTSVESICKIQNSLISAEKATAALEAMMDREVLALEGIDIDWHKKWEAVKAWFQKFWKAIKDFFQAMWTKIRSYIGPNRDLYKTIDMVNKVAKGAGLAAELEKLNKSFKFDAQTGTFVFSDEIAKEVIEAFRAKIAALPEDKKNTLKKMLDPNYKPEADVTSSDTEQGSGFSYKHESEAVQNSMQMVACTNICLETLNIELDPKGFVSPSATRDAIGIIEALTLIADSQLNDIKPILSHTIDKATIDNIINNSKAASRPHNGPYGSFNLTIAPGDNGHVNYQIDVKIRTFDPSTTPEWDLSTMATFVQDCDNRQLPQIAHVILETTQKAEQVNERIDWCKFADDVNSEDITKFANNLASALTFVTDIATLTTKILGHLMRMRATCVKTLAEVYKDTLMKTIVEA